MSTASFVFFSSRLLLFGGISFFARRNYFKHCSALMVGSEGGCWVRLAKGIVVALEADANGWAPSSPE